MRTYETMFILDTQLNDEAKENEVKDVENFIRSAGGEIQTIEKWGVRPLAYEIKKKREGYYVLIRFTAEGTTITELERNYRLKDCILRYLTVVLPDKAKQTVKQTEVTELIESTE